MKVYICMQFECRLEARKIMEKFIKAGHEVTRDWTRMPIPEKATPRMKELLMNYAADIDLQGIKEADAVILVLPGNRGSHGEFAAALALHKYCILVGKPNIQCLIHWHSNTIKCQTISGALHLINELSELIDKDPNSWLK